MHINDLRFYKTNQLLELALVLGVKVDASRRLDDVKIKQDIVAFYNKLPPLLQSHRKQVDRFICDFA